MRTSPYLAVACVVLGVVCGLAEAEDDIPRISVTGTAVTRTVPDEALWQISISEFDQTPLPPKNRSDEKLKTILGLAKELGVAPEDIQAGSLSIRREYDHDEQGRQTTFKHFAVNRHVTLRQCDLTQGTFAPGAIEVRVTVYVDFEIL